MKKAGFILLDQYADWEGSYLSAILAQESFSITTLSTQETVQSIGGFTTKIDTLITKENPLIDFDLLVLIGGNSWHLDFPEITQLLTRYIAHKKPVAAICGAVDYLAKKGLLTNFSHTGNAQFFWNDFDNYLNKEQFLEQQAVLDKQLVTANGTATLDFTELTLEMVGFTQKEAQKKVDMYRLGYYDFCEKYGNPYLS